MRISILSRNKRTEMDARDLNSNETNKANKATFFFKSVVPRVRWIKSYWKMYVGMSRHSVQYKCKSDQSVRAHAYTYTYIHIQWLKAKEFPFHRYSTRHSRKHQSQNPVVEFNTKWMRFSRPTSLQEALFFRDLPSFYQFFPS